MLTGGTARLKMAVGYGVAAAAAVTPDLLSSATPCRGWDLETLLLHALDSMDALADGVACGRVALRPTERSGEFGCDPLAAFTERAELLIGACALADGAGDRGPVPVGGCPLDRGLLLAAGALEIAMHGWDMFRACGCDEPVPELLALDLLRIAPALITRAERGSLFAWPVAVPAGARPSDRLAAFLGREPGRRARSSGSDVCNAPAGIYPVRTAAGAAPATHTFPHRAGYTPRYRT
jgi:uncharacterized protein (TIGR03086 family)